MLTKTQNIKRDEDIVVHDICHCNEVNVLALNDVEKNKKEIKVEVYDAYTTYALWEENDYHELGIKGYWWIDGGSLG